MRALLQCVEVENHDRPIVQLQETIALHGDQALVAALTGDGREVCQFLVRDQQLARAARVQQRVHQADQPGAAFVTLGEVVGCDFAAYPNVQRWLERMKALESWKPVNATLDRISAAHKGEPFVTV